MTLRMKWRSICSVTSKSAMTPSLSGRIALIVAGRAAQHALGLGADGVDFAGAVVDGDDRRLGEHDALAAEIDERVGGAKVDGHVAGAEARDETEEADDELLSMRFSNDDCIRCLWAWPPEAGRRWRRGGSAEAGRGR